MILPDPITILFISVISLIISGIAFFKKVLDQGVELLNRQFESGQFTQEKFT